MFLKDREAVLTWLTKIVVSLTASHERDELISAFGLGSPQSVMKRCGANLVAGDWIATVRDALIYGLRKDIAFETVMQEVTNILGGKGVGYGSNDNYLANFFEIGRVFNQHPVEMCKAYAYKHVDCLIRGEVRGKLLGPEGMIEKLADIVLYAGLGKAIVSFGE